MPIKKSSATAFINVRGLGIVCFNPQKKRSETAIIRSGNHKFSINVLQPVFLDESGKDAFGYVPLANIPQISDADDVVIEISGVGNPKIEGYEFFQTGDFERLDGNNDENDFRWILNLEGEEMHDKSLSKNEKYMLAEKPPVSKLFIENGLFYAVMPNDEELEKTPFFLKQNSAENANTDFGYIAETMGVNIEADEVLLKITVNGNENQISLKRIEGFPFKIEINNVDPNPEAMTSDLPVCYQFLTAADGQEYNLVPLNEESSGGGAVVGKNYCHITRVNQDSIDNFV